MKVRALRAAGGAAHAGRQRCGRIAETAITADDAATVYGVRFSEAPPMFSPPPGEAPRPFPAFDVTERVEADARANFRCGALSYYIRRRGAWVREGGPYSARLLRPCEIANGQE